MTIRREKAERLADEELMPLIGAKDPEAFEVFYDRHGGVAYSLAYRIVGEKGAAEDVTQEAFISIWRSGARFDRARGSVRSWMLSIVRNRAIDALRSRAGGLPAFSYSDPAITPAVSPIRAQHILDLRNALQDVYVKIGVTPPAYSTSPAPSGAIVTADVAELRTAVLAIE